MARPRKRINNTPYPNHVIDAIARAFYPNLLEDWLEENSIEKTNTSATTIINTQINTGTSPEEINISNIT